MDINGLITRLYDIACDFPKNHTINQAADMLTVLQAENNKLQDELKRRDAEIARLNEAREIANEKAREYESRVETLEDQQAIINILRRDVRDIKTSYHELQGKLKKEAEARKKQADIITEERSQKYEQIKIIDNLKKELEQVKKERDAAVKCIEDIEAAFNFQRVSAIGLRISEWRGLEE